MQKMARMRPPSPSAKISGASLEEIKEALTNETQAQRRRGLRVLESRALEDAHLFNSYLLWILRQPKTERNRIADEGTALYRSYLASEVPLPVIVDTDADTVIPKGSPGANRSGSGTKPERHNGRSAKGDRTPSGTR